MLDECRGREVGINFTLTLPELFFHSLLFSDVSHGHHYVVLAIWSLNHPPAEDYRDPLAVLTWKVKLAAMPAVAMPQFVLADNMGNILGGEDCVGCTSAQFVEVVLPQSCQCFIGKNDAKLVINNDHSFVELFKDILHLAKPIGSIDIGLRHGFVQLNSFVKIVCRDRAAE